MIEIHQLPEVITELKRRFEHPFTTYIPTNKPGHDQLAFHSSLKRYRLLFGGNQSGKSYAAACEISYWALGKHPFRPVPPPGGMIWVISSEYETLKHGVYRHLRNIIPDWEIEKEGPNVPGHDLPTYIRLKNETIIEFKSAKGTDQRGKFQAAAVKLIAADEEITENIWEELEARTLNTGGSFILTLTPIESYDWIVKLEQLGLKNDPHVFITYLDTELNHYLDTDTVNFLKAKWSHETLETRFKGHSRRTVGLIYSNWNDQRNIIPPFNIPHEWPRWCALDPGIRTFAALWIAVSPDNKAYAYRELYAHNEPLYQIAIQIKTLEGWVLNDDLSHKFNHFVWETPEEMDNINNSIGTWKAPENILVRIIDDKINSRLITGEQGVLNQLYDRYGIASTPADKNKRAGIEDCRHWVENGFQVFSILSDFLEERRQYRIRSKKVNREQNEPIDDPIKKKDHLMDCWRYIARERPQYNQRIRTYTEEIERPSTIDWLRNKKQQEVNELEAGMLV